MRPLPPFNARPLRRKRVAKIAARAMPRDLAETGAIAVRMSGGLKVKPQAARQKPQLKVLGEKAAAC